MDIIGAEELRREAEAIRANGFSSLGASHTSLLVDVTTAPVGDLVTLIGPAIAQLKEIELNCGSVVGDISGLSHAISQCFNLTQLTWYNCRASEADITILGVGLAQLPKLQDLTISFERGRVPESSPWKLVAPALCRPGNVLRRVEVTNGNFVSPRDGDVDAMEELQQMFAASYTLQCLILDFGGSFGFPAPVAKWAGQMVRKSSSLITFEIQLDAGVSIVELAKDLRFNQSLTDLRIRKAGVDEEVPLATFREEASTLHTTLRGYNFSLERVDVLPWMDWGWSDRTIDPWKATRRQRKINELPVAVQTDLAGIYFFQGLNKASRGFLVGPNAGTARWLFRHLEPFIPAHQTEPRTLDWIATIGKHTDELSTVYYYLRQNPSLVKVATEDRKKARGVEKRKTSKRKKRDCVEGVSASGTVVSALKKCKAGGHTTTKEAGLTIVATTALDSVLAALEENPQAFSTEERTSLSVTMQRVQSKIGKSQA